MNQQRYKRLLTCLLIAMAASCNKNYLLLPPKTSFTVPQTPQDFQALLDNEALFSQTPAAGFLSADECLLTDDYTDLLSTSGYNLYTWQKNIYGPEESVPDWDQQYEQVLYANQTLAGLLRLNRSENDTVLLNTLQGASCFLRAYAFYNLAQLYAPPYDKQAPSTTPGIPLPTSVAVNTVVTRASLEATYQQIISDLQKAVTLLPDSIDKKHPNRPSRPAAYAMLSRVCLSMRLYEEAATASDSCLRLYQRLTDYNNLDTESLLPFSATHAEILYQSRLQEENRLLMGLIAGGASIDTALYKGYAPGDLRPALFFRRTAAGLLIKGSYSGTFNPFTGLTTSEVFLIRAESRAQLGQTAAALTDLNTLRCKRIRPTYFTPLQTTRSDTALAWIRAERQKELVLRGTRWTDLRRLNKEGACILLTRTVRGKTDSLFPNDPRYSLPIPPLAILQGGLEQNNRGK